MKGKCMGSMVAVGVIAVAAAIGMSGTAYALAIADAWSNTTGGWSVTTTGTLVITPTSEWSYYAVSGFSPVSGLYGDSNSQSSIADTSATSSLSELQGSHSAAASTTAGHMLSASSHTESNWDLPWGRSGGSYASQGVSFAATGTGNLILTVPYELSVSASGTTTGDDASAYANVQVWLSAYDAGGDAYGSRSKQISKWVSGVQSDSQDFSGIVTLIFGLQDADWGSFGVNNYAGAHAYSPAPVPEPATMLLLGSGLAGMGWFGRKRIKKDSEA